jgi:acyl-CoA synthetase (AMP-forming)/AMP-acid ligase II
MDDSTSTSTAAQAGTRKPLNVARRLSVVAREMPEGIAVVEPLGYLAGKRQYRQISFRALEDDSDRIARGLVSLGVSKGAKIALLVRPGIDFISLVFALYKAGCTVILIDPGMGRVNVLRCLADAEPEGFVAIPLVHAVRTVLAGRFPKSWLHVTVGRRWFWGGPTLDEVRRLGQPERDLPEMAGDDPAAIIFTTGSTGPPKGVLYTHGNFDAQVDQIRERFDIRPGEIDLPGFPLFGLFNCAMGVTAVIPDMDPSRPAQVDPRKILEAGGDWQVTQTFGSPAIWNRVGRYCREHKLRMPTVRRVLSAGAPVPAEVLAMVRECIHPEGEVFTPYGATEALPVASIGSREVLGETAARTREGAGVCVGRRFSGIQWKVIRVVDGPIRRIEDVEELPGGEIGELIVRGPVITREYVTRRESNATGKIVDGESVWHRMGDVGYLDSVERFWFCGRMAHRVRTAGKTLYTIPCEAIFNQHPAIYRSALVGIGPPGEQRPVIILEPRPGQWPNSRHDRENLLAEIRRLASKSPLTEGIGDFLLHRSFPVDIRHNAKIFREKLAVWAAGELDRGS